MLVLSSATVALTAPASAAPASGPAATPLAQTGAIVASLQTRSSATDPRYVQDNIIVDGSPDCLRCTLGPAALFAVYGVRANDPAATALSVRVLDRAIKDHQQPDGSFTPPSRGEQGPAIQTVFTVTVLAEAYLVLGERLDCNHRAAWSRSLTLAADYLIRTKELSWYTNGNINLAKTVDMDLVSRITHEARFHTAADASYAFTLSPPQDRWKGFGLRYTRTSSAANGSNGAAYLAESGAGGVGYDPSYTTFQVNLAATWFALTRDDRALRLTNLLYNQLASRVRTTDWTIDIGGGTRHTARNVRYGFTVSALPVLAALGGRTDLRTAMTSQLPVIMAEYARVTALVSPGSSYGYGVELSPALLAALPTPASTLRTFSCAS